MNNPLLAYARRPELSVKLPSNGKWYPDGMIKYTLNGEVEVYPMTPKDELMLLNPDALLSGDANIRLIESCVPSIKNAGDLLYPDANVLLLAIRRATYGKTMTNSFVCQSCGEKALEINDENKILEMETKGEILTETQTTNVDIDYFLQTISYLEEEYVYKTEDGLKIYFTPTLLKDKLHYSLIDMNNRKLIKYFQNYEFDENNEEEIKKEISSKISEIYMNINEEGNKMITDSIKYIKLPDDGIVDDKTMILEYVSQSKSSMISELHKKIKELNDIGINKKVEHICKCCGHSFEERLAGYNQVDFFGSAS